LLLLLLLLLLFNLTTNEMKNKQARGQ